MPVIHKAGASNHARPDPSSAGSQSAAVSDPRAKLRALAEAMGGPCIVRDADGNGFLLTVEALKFIPLSHEVVQ